MAEPIRTPTIVINIDMTTVSLSNQYQIGGFAIHTALQAAGWTVERSSNGTVAGAGNNIASSADWVEGTSGNGVWAAYQSPLGWLTGTERGYLLLYSNSTTSRNLQSRVSDATYTGGSSSSLPTTAGQQSSDASHRLIPSTATADPAYCNTWAWDNGDVWYMRKNAGPAVPATSGFWQILGFRDSDSYANGDPRRYLINYTSTSLTNNIRRSIYADGSGAATPDAYDIGPTLASNWLAGTDHAGRFMQRPIEYSVNSVATGRYYGFSPDWFKGGLDTPFNQQDTAETGQTFRTCALLRGYWFWVPDGSFFD